ncbi:MAG: Trp family transcriptional regulator [Candidatus Erginobacter occultus]|jgi:TrpR family transcriptional regulator, trp operon repressor|nr:Trp family transcriptional regulator [Candidatus Erginobacter occultus]
MDKLPEIAGVLAQIDDPGLLERFFREIFTPKEVRDISSRWELVKLLERGVTQREIARTLGLSLCKITRGARELKRNDSALRRVIRRRAGEGG